MPINSYLEQASAPAIKSQPASDPNPSLDLIGLLLGDSSSQITEISSTSTPTVATPTVFDTPSKTLTPTATSTLTATPSFTFAPTLTPTLICSRPSTTPAETTFFNSSAQTIEIYLVDSSCNLILYNTLGPEQSVVLSTVIGQLWWFIDTPVGRLISDYVVSSVRETVDVSTGAITIPPTGTASPFIGFTVSNVVLSDDLSQFGTSITLAPGQEFYVSYDFRVFNDPCPDCNTLLITGLGTSGSYGGTCAYNGVPGVSPGVTGVESVTLYAPSSSGTYPVIVEYHWLDSCSIGLVNYGTGEYVSTQFIGHITVP